MPEIKPLTNAQILLNLVGSLCFSRPHSKPELIERTGYTGDQVKNAITRLKSDEFPQWRFVNVGSPKRAKWKAIPLLDLFAND